jgi:hypothetical protein
MEPNRSAALPATNPPATNVASVEFTPLRADLSDDVRGYVVSAIRTVRIAARQNEERWRILNDHSAHVAGRQNTTMLINVDRERRQLGEHLIDPRGGILTLTALDSANGCIARLGRKHGN